MQRSVDIVGTSKHPANKVAATLVGEDHEGKPYIISKTNHWPDAIAERIGTDVRIGNSSGTIHAETECLLHAPGATKGASVYATDPPCPNCMKNMAEAGIRRLYIDHKGFEKDFAQRRGEAVENMSMRIAAKAGIDVYTINRKTKTIEALSLRADDYKPALDNPPSVTLCGCGDFTEALAPMHGHFGYDPFAMALAEDTAQHVHCVAASPHLTIGYTQETAEDPQSKYSFVMEPINRVLMLCARYGYTIKPDCLYSSRVPSSRELVNLVGAGFSCLRIGDIHSARDEHGPRALEQLRNAGLVSIKT